MTEYKCLNCGWEGEDIIEWEEHPRDEFYLKCPKCYHIDGEIQVWDGKYWVPAVVYREPTPEEIEQGKRRFEKLNQMLASTNVYLEALKEKAKEYNGYPPNLIPEWIWWADFKRWKEKKE